MSNENLSQLSPELLVELLKLGSTSATPFTIDTNGDPIAIVPDGLKVLDLKAFVDPKRIERSPAFTTAASFVAYVNLFKESSTLICAATVNGASIFTAFLDYHAPGQPARVAHKATFVPVVTEDWKTLMASNRTPFGQVEFATWLEENARFIATPVAAELLELVQSLSGKSDVRFTSGIRLQSGTHKLQFEEDVELRGSVSSREGAVELPSALGLAVQPFDGAASYSLSARLKYRIAGKQLALWYEIVTPHLVVRDAVQLIVDLITKETGLTPLYGSL
jgi:uncharacterized protein YfdQ (DUF2303 family)